MQQTFSAPLASIQINGTKVGYIRDLNFTETVQRGEIQGVGESKLIEAPALAFRNQFTASAWFISLKLLGNVKDPFWPVDATDPKTMLNTILLNETPVPIHIYKKTKNQVDQTTGLVLGDVNYERVAIIPDALVNSRSWNISDGQVSGKTINGIYLTPVFLI